MSDAAGEVVQSRLQQADDAVITVYCRLCLGLPRNCDSCDAAIDEWIMRNGMPLDEWTHVSALEAVSEVKS